MERTESGLHLSRREFVGGVAALALLAACGNARAETEAPDAVALDTYGAQESAPQINQPAGGDLQPATRGTSVQVGETLPPPAQQLFAPGELIRKIDTNLKVVCFTMDDGPWPVNTQAAMDTFESRGYPGLIDFFMVANNLQRYADIGREVQARGFGIASHAKTHATYVPSQIAAEFVAAQEIFGDVLGYAPEAGRSPGLTTGQVIQDTLAQLGMYNLFTDKDLRDWVSPRLSSDTLVQNFEHALHPGLYVLVHDGGSHMQTINALHGMLDVVEREGYTLLSRMDMLRIRAGLDIGRTIAQAG